MPWEKNRVAVISAVSFAAAATLAACNGGGILRSTATLGEMALSADAIDFGAQDCGGEAPASKTLTLTNDGEGPLRWSATLDSNAFFDLAGDRAGTLEAGESVTITVTARRMPSEAAAGEVKNATVLLTTDDAARPTIYVPIKSMAQGATLELISPTEADFGKVPVGVEAPAIAMTLKNTGNAPAKVAVGAPADDQYSFAWSGGGAVEVAPGGNLTGLSAKFTPKTAVKSSTVGLFEVEGAVCGKSASSVAVRGEGLGGVVGMSPGTVDLGKVGCNTKANPQTITVYNSGNLVYTFSASLKDGSNYTLTPSGGAVVAGGTVQLTLTPKALGMTTNLVDNGFGDTVTITTDVPGDMPHEIPVKQTAAGAILKWSSQPLDFGTQTLFTASAGKLLAISNDGNQAATVKVNGSDVFVGTSGSVPGGGGVFVSTVKYTPDNLGAQKSDIAILTTDPICQPLPGSVSAVGAGKGAASAIALGGPPRNRGSAQGGCVILANTGGRVACFGSNQFGQLGTKVTTTGPSIIPDLKDVVGISSAGDFNCAVDKAGSVWCWGNNRNHNRQESTGKLGVVGVDSTEVPVQVSGVTNATKVSVGHNMACALTMAGDVLCWGSNRRGKLGTGGDQSQNQSAQLVSNLSGATDIAVGGGGGCARINDGTVRCWGQYGRGNLGTCCGPQAMQVQNMGDATNVAAMTAGGRTGPRCALRMDGQVSCWGDPARGQLGAGFDFRGAIQSPVTVGLSGAAVQVVGFQNGGCARMQDKTVQCWGRNEGGQVGNGTNFQHNSPAQVTGLNDAEALAAGGTGVCALVGGGGVKCWGNYGIGSSNVPQSLKYF